MNTNLKFAIGIKNITDAMIHELKENDVETYDMDGGMAFVWDNSLEDVYDNVSDLGIEPDAINSTLVGGIVNVNDGRFYERHKITDALKKDLDIKNDEFFSADLLSSVGLDSDELKSVIEDEKKEVDFQFYGAVNKDDHHVEELTTSDGTSSIPESKNDAEPLEEKKTVAEEQPLNEGNVSEDNNKENTSDLNDDASDNNELPNNQVSEAIDSTEVDPLLKFASKLFKERTQVEFPFYDEMVSKQLLPELVKGETETNHNQDKAVYQIYERLQKAYPKIELDFEKQFEESENKHDETLKKIDNDENEEIGQLEKEYQEKYEHDCQSFIDGQINVLKVQFDKDHKQEYDFNLNHAKEEIHAKYDRERQSENERYEAFREEEENKYLEAQLGKVDISEIIDDFDKENERQIEIIRKAATKFKDQVAVATKQIAAKRDEWKQKAEVAENKAQTLNDTFEKRIASDVKEQVQDKVKDLHEELKRAKEEAINTTEKMQKMSAEHSNEMHELNTKHTNEMDEQRTRYEAELHQARHDAEKDKNEALKKQENQFDSKYQKLQDQYNNLEKQSSAEKDLKDKEIQHFKEENDLQQSLIADLKKQKDKIEKESENANIKNVKAEVTPISYASSTEVHHESTKMSKGTKWLIGGLTAIALLGGGSALYMVGSHSGNQPTTSVSTTSVQSQGTKAPYAKGQKVSYTDNQGVKHEVTIDSTSGNTSVGYYNYNGTRYQVKFSNN